MKIMSEVKTANGAPSVYHMTSRSVPLDEAWDVIVVGGGPAGTAAAAAAARAGAKTLLVEAMTALGGMGTLGLVPWFCGYADGEKIIAQGYAERIRQALCDHWKQAYSWDPAIDPEFLKRYYDRMVTEAGATVLFQTCLASVEMASDGRVDAVVMSNKRGLCAYRAKVYVDCTGDGDLAAWAGACFEKGDEKGDLQPATMCFTLTNVEPYDCWYDATRPAGSTPSLHFFDPESPIHKAVASARYPFIIDQHSCSKQIGPKSYSYNFGHVFDVDNTDPANVSGALIRGRVQAAQYRDAFAEMHPAFKDAFLAATGGLLGVRETRRIAGDYRLTMEDYLACRSFDDEIARNAYNIDVHSDISAFVAHNKDNREAVCKKIHDEIKQLSTGESYGVPYRCLTPRGLRNVLVAGRCISTDRPVNGSVRIMACCLTTGEAAGAAAAFVARSSGADVHAVDVAELRRHLVGHGAYLPSVKS